MKKYVAAERQLSLGESDPFLFWLWDGRSNKVLRIRRDSVWPERSNHTAASMKRAIASGEFVLVKEDK